MPVALRIPERTDREWTRWALRVLASDASRTAETNLRTFPLPESWAVDLYLKDESGQPTGSLKHRLARSLFQHGLVAGRIGSETSIVEASSGSTAVSEAYFARLLGLPFITVVPTSTSRRKIEEIETQGGRCVFIADSSRLSATAIELAAEIGGYFMDQFANAAVATDWRRDNIMSSVTEQLRNERHSWPNWVVLSAGTGGTSATVGRYIAYSGMETRLCVADPEDSAFFSAWRSGDTGMHRGSRIEGIGRPTAEVSFLPEVVDAMARVPDRISIATMRALHVATGIRAGASTGTNLAAALLASASMAISGTDGSVVTLICDRGERYLDTYFDDEWCRAQGWNPQEDTANLLSALSSADPTALIDALDTEWHDR